MLRKIMLCAFFVIMTIGYGQGSIGSYRTKDRGRFVPKLMSYQGYLTDTLGIPIDDILDMTFNIYDIVTGGTLWWTETQTNIPIVRGIFNVMLGTNNTIPDSVFVDGTDRWLELILEGPVTLAPRTRVTSAGYAYMATYSDTAEYARNVDSDNDWGRGTPDSVLFTVDFLGLARGNAFNEMLGEVHRQVNFGVSCTTGNSGSGSGDVAILSGWGCKADSAYGTIVNGVQNKARGQLCFIGSGQSNIATGQASAIVGGQDNSTSGYRSFIGGGYSNVAGNSANDSSAVVVGGWDNSVTNKYSFIGGGQGNSVTNFSATIGGGGDNSVLGYYASLLGGDGNTAAGPYTTVGGGRDIYAAGEYAAILGGFRNRTNATYATIGGGDLNYVEGQYSAILGGYADTIFSTANYSYLFGIRAKCTEDSTFMVDMPHIWFGDEINGYEFPVDDGLADQVMATDGSGQLVWTDVEDSDWTISVNDMYSNVSGNVGIGTPTPDYKLDVAGDASFDNYLLHNGDVNTYLQFTTNQVDITAGGVNMIRADNTTQDILVLNENSNDVDFRIESNTDSHAFFLRGSDGNIGIGISDPGTYKLNVRSYVNGAAAIRGADQSAANTYAEGQLGVLGVTGMPYNPTNIGVLGIKPNAGADGVAIYGWNNDAGTDNHAVYAVCDGSGTNNYALYASASNAATNNWAGYFDGDVNIDGDFIVSGAVPEDNDWTRGTPDSVLFTSNLVGIARGDANNVFYGDSAYSHINLGVVCTTGTNSALTQHIVISGGYGNRARFNYGIVCGGLSNTALGSFGVIVGGRDNVANAYSFVGGGYANAAGSNIIMYATVSGGQADTVKGRHGSILGGYSNLAGDADIDTAVVVVGGWNNSATAKYAFIGGGKSNTSSAEYGVVAGGIANDVTSTWCGFVGGGSNNSVNGDYATIPGGRYNHADGTWSFAAGYHAVASHTGCFVWGDGSSTSDFTTTASNQFLIRATGGVGIATIYPNTDFHVAGKATIGSAFTPTSTEDENVVNLIVGTNTNGAQNGIAFCENTSGYAMKLGYNGVGSGDANMMEFYDSDDDPILSIQNGGSVMGYGDNGSFNFIFSNLAGYGDNGYIAVADSDGAIQASMYVNASGDGIITGDVKSFHMDNPSQPGTQIWYTCIEGPEAAAYVRGTGHLVNGRAVIDLPQHFVDVASPNGITVQLTPLSVESNGLAVIEKDLDGIVVGELHDGSGTYEFDFMVVAVRKGYEDYKVIRPGSEMQLEISTSSNGSDL